MGCWITRSLDDSLLAFAAVSMGLLGLIDVTGRGCIFTVEPAPIVYLYSGTVSLTI